MNQRLQALRLLAMAIGRLAWSSLKDGIKVLIGREPSVNEQALFLRQFILHLTGIRPIGAITCVRRSGQEGPGSQALMIMNAINFARASGFTYVHTPFALVHGADRPRQEWVQAWDTLFNLGDGEVAAGGVGGRRAVNFCYHFADLELCFGWRFRRDELTRHFKATLPDFRRKYYLSQSPRTTPEVTVAVNIRRGSDVSSDLNRGHFTNTQVIMQTVRAVKAILDSHNLKYRIDVYSNGNSDEFSDFAQLGAGVFTNPHVDVIWTMRELIEADVLITAKSLFSYYAALISDGIKIFEPRITLSSYRNYRDFLPSWAWLYLDPPDDWIATRADGCFDAAAFERQLLLLIHAKTAEGGMLLQSGQ